MLGKQVTAVSSSCELSAPRNSLTGPAGEMSLLWERSRQAHALCAHVYIERHRDMHIHRQNEQQNKEAPKAQNSYRK